MKYIIFAVFMCTSLCWAEDYPSCNLSKTKNVGLFASGAKAKISVSVKGSPCFKALLEIQIHHGDRLLYSYREEFKLHTAIHWQDLSENSAQNYINGVLESYNVIKCRKLLPSKLEKQDISGWSYNSLSIPAAKYEAYKASDCFAFIHQTSYESNRVIVFPHENKVGIIVSEYGL